MPGQMSSVPGHKQRALLFHRFPSCDKARREFKRAMYLEILNRQSNFSLILFVRVEKELKK
jgi:hypothetical protein